MKTQFLGQAYQARSPILATQTAINIYPSVVQTEGSEKGGFYGTPGLLKRYQGSGPVRGLHQADGYLYAAIGNSAYRIDTTYSAEFLGNFPNSYGNVSIIDNGSQVAFAHQDGWHWVSFTGGSIAPVSGAPAGTILTEQDNYVIYTDATTGVFGITALGDLSSIDPLDFASAEGAPDPAISVMSLNRELWVFGSRTTEVWINSGAALFPFSRAPSGFFEMGCAARWSVVRLDSSVFWVGQDGTGDGIVYRNNGYAAMRISTPAIEYALNKIGDISDAIGYGYQDDGHSFYVLTFPTGQQTWVYDIATKAWHQRAYMDPDTGLLQQHRSSCYAFYNGAHIVGDRANGKVYQMSLDYYDDDGDNIYRERAWELPDNENKRIRGDFLELYALTGDGVGDDAPNVTLEVSQDGGRRWGYEREQTMGKAGQHTARARWRRLGAGRNTVYRVSTQMKNRVQWVAAYFKGEALSN